jgi:hypothetical protein
VVAGQVQRRDHLGGEPAGFVEHRVHRVGVDLGMARHSLQDIDSAEQFVHHELHVANRGRVAGHR